MNRPALFESIEMGAIGTEISAWNKVIDAQTIADIAEFVFQRFIRPEQTSAGQRLRNRQAVGVAVAAVADHRGIAAGKEPG